MIRRCALRVLVPLGAALCAPAAGQGACLGEVLLAPGGLPGDEFGSSVAVDGDVAVLGAPLRGEVAIKAGAAYVYRFDGSAWRFEQELVRPDPEAQDYYGFAVAVSGTLAAVASVFDDEQGVDSGSVYLFRFDGVSWAHEQKLVPFGFARDEWMGFSLALTGDSVGSLLAAGAPGKLYPPDLPGSVYVFRSNGSQYFPEQQLFAADRSADDQFGFDVDLTHDALLVGSPGDDDAGEATGSAYVFTGVHGAWFEVQKLVAPDPGVGHRFGRAVAFVRGGGAIGSPGDDAAGEYSGAVHLFDPSWSLSQTVRASDAAARQAFGRSLAVCGDRMLVGSPGEFGDGDGAYVFAWDGDAWSESRRIGRPCGAGPTAWFGTSLALTESVALLGAPQSDENCRHDTTCNVGAAYAFDPNGGCDCAADINDDGVLDSRDVLSFLNMWTSRECRADFNADGEVNTLDVLAFLNAFTAGCG